MFVFNAQQAQTSTFCLRLRPSEGHSGCWTPAVTRWEATIPPGNNTGPSHSHNDTVQRLSEERRTHSLSQELNQEPSCYEETMVTMATLLLVMVVVKS